MGIKRGTGRLVTSLFIFALLLGTAWTGRAAVARVDVDPALDAGEVALIQVAAGTAWTVAADLTAAGASEVAAFESVDIVTARLSGAALANIGTDRSVLRATTDARVTAIGGGPNNGKDLDEFGSASKKDSLGIDAISAPAAWALSTGAGVVVALMDSGIAAHPDLPAGKVIARANFAGTNGIGLDPAGHGTHLAGIIAANGSTFRGVAPNAHLVDIRVLDQNGDGSLHTVVAGFDWLLKNRSALNIRVLNLSLGMTQRSSYHEDLLAALAEAAWFAGIAVVAAAGNEGPAPGAIATPGADPFIITAGSYDDQGTPSTQDDRESAFSSRGLTIDGFAKPDVLAPGRRVVSLRANGSQLELTKPERVVTNTTANGNGNASGKNSNNLYVRMSGTSVSSAMVSGVAALVLSVHADYTPTKTKGAIVASGRSLTGTVSRAVTASTAVFAFPRAVNRLLLPSELLMTTLENSGVVEGGTNWEGVTWEGVTWEAVTWEGVSWESITWESVSWEGVMWETVSWEQSPLLDGER